MNAFTNLEGPLGPIETFSDDVSADVADNSPRMISARDLCGGVSDMTLWCWLNDPDRAFPRPTYNGKRRYFREAEISAWIEAQAEASRGAAQ